MSGRPDAALTWMTDGFAYFTAKLSAIGDAELDAPSGLPGWSRKHVVAHLGFNARAVARLVHWAKTGEVTPMYSDPNARAKEIETGARWDARRLRAFVRTEQEALAAALGGLDEADWSAQVMTGQGRRVDASEIPWLRTREVWIHAVDLNAGGDFTDFPPDMVDRLVVEVVKKRRAGHTPALNIRPTDRSILGLLDVPPVAGAVDGTAADLARWLTRRETRGVRTADGSPLPELDPWL